MTTLEFLSLTLMILVVVLISVSIILSVDEEEELELELDDLTQTVPSLVKPSGQAATTWHLSSFRTVPSGHLVGTHFPFLKT